MRMRLLLVLSLLGLLLTAHLHIQKVRGFDRGCLGLSAPAGETAGLALPCRDVGESAGGRFLGVEVEIYGYLYYAATALLAHAAATGGGPGRLAAAALGPLVLAGVAASAWFTWYQHAVLGAVCALCHASAALCLAIALARFLAPWREPDGDPAATARECAFLSLSTLAFAAALGFDLALVNGAGTGEARRDAVERILVETLPQAIDRKWLAQMAPCSFAEGEPPRPEAHAIVPRDAPAIGPADAPVVAVDFFDPLCPKCAELARAIGETAPRFAGRVRFEFYPLPIAPKSVKAVEALLLAQERGRFVAMAEALFARTAEVEPAPAELCDLAAAAGLDRDAFAADLASGRMTAAALARRDAYRALGYRAVPTLLVNGRAVARSAGALTGECLSALLGGLAGDEEGSDAPER